ncbi:MAG: 3-oxoadipate enol-lactonase [Chloroflexota bacterium]
MTLTRFATLHGLNIHYRQEGRDTGVPLVFINSLGSDLRIWDEVVSNLGSHFPILRYDKRGHGLSECPDAPYTIRDHSQDLAALLHHLSIDKVILIGISVGGMIALDFASQHPQHVSALVLCDTAAKIGSADMWQERIETLREHGMAYLGDTILSRWFAPTFATKRPADYRGYYHMLTRVPVEGYTGTCEAIRDADLSKAVKTIQAHTLVLCGQEDLATTPAMGQALANMMPNAHFEVIKDAGHLPCIEQPSIMTHKIKTFLTSINTS